MKLIFVCKGTTYKCQDKNTGKEDEKKELLAWQSEEWSSEDFKRRKEVRQTC